MPAGRDDQLRIKLGRLRDSGGGRRARGFIGRVLAAAQKSGHGWGREGKVNRRGAFGRGRVASWSAERLLSDRSRRVIVKARVVRHGPRMAPLRAHLAYLKRDGVSRDGSSGEMFGSDGTADERGFAQQCHGDRHHFRFTVSPEDATEMADLRDFTRDLMHEMERDLGTRLDWVAVDHWNTDNPHVHIVLRGRADAGDDLVISRDYIARGLRARAAELATLELGSQSEVGIRRKLRLEVSADRWTRLDATLRRLAGPDGLVDLRPVQDRGGDPDLRNTLLGRAQRLERLGLARPVGPAQWLLAEEAEPTLRELGLRGDIVKTMHRAMARAGDERPMADYAIHKGAAPQIRGKLIVKGLIDEMNDQSFVIIDGVDGRLHYVPVGVCHRMDDLPVGAVVATGVVEERDHVSTGGQLPERVRRPAADLQVLSDLPVEQQIGADGATWLDRELVGKTDLATHGFGQEVRDALEHRAEHLVAAGLARRQANRILFVRDLLDRLTKRELAAAGSALARDTGLEHQVAAQGARVSGVYRRRLDLASGRYALIEDGRQFVLVPWRPIVEERLGREVSGVVRGNGVFWNFGRNRGPSVG